MKNVHVTIKVDIISSPTIFTRLLAALECKLHEMVIKRKCNPLCL